MKNINRIILISLLTLFMLSNCSDDFLEKIPQGELSEEILATEKGVNAVLIGAYAMMDGYSKDQSDANNGHASPLNWIFGDICSDDAYTGHDGVAWADISFMERFNTQANNPRLLGCWSVNYDAVSRTNDVLRILKKVKDIPKKNADQIEAEARFLRAWFHFQLQLVFEKIPYITEDVDPVTVPNDGTVWDEIEADLQWGIDNGMKEKHTELGRATRWAAKALKAKAHMFQKEFTQAKPLLDDIINNGPFKLEDQLWDNFSEENEHGKESIFEVEYSVNDGSDPHNSGIDHVVNYPRGLALGFDYDRPSHDLFNAFKVTPVGLPMLDNFQDSMVIGDRDVLTSDAYKPTTVLLDPRVDWSIGRRGIPFLDWGVHMGSSWFDKPNARTNMGPYHCKKTMFFKKNQKTISPPGGTYWADGINGKNWRVLRYAQILLWRAEVAAEEEDLPTATSLVNQIRTRASDDKGDYVMGRVLNNNINDSISIDSTQRAANYLIGFYPTFPDKVYALKAVRMENRLEFALEGQRFFDLVRWGIDAQVMQKYWSEDYIKKLTIGEVVDYVKDKHDHWPIPQTQIDLQKGVLAQDPAY